MLDMLMSLRNDMTKNCHSFELVDERASVYFITVDPTELLVLEVSVI